MIRWIFFVELPSSTTFNYIFYSSKLGVCRWRLNWSLWWGCVWSIGVEWSKGYSCWCTNTTPGMWFRNYWHGSTSIFSDVVFVSVFDNVVNFIKVFIDLNFFLLIKALLALSTRICLPTVKRGLLLFIFLLKLILKYLSIYSLKDYFKFHFKINV